ncbi:MAG: hypothetical protein JW760_11935 [Spirochaetales bacterium]|nr:hypothetical protein [Spirochaetales bacterium]
MEHLTFLIQVLSLILAFSSLLLLIHNRSASSRGIIFFFSAALVLIIARTVIFALARYGQISRLFIFPACFTSSHLSGGLIYVSLVFSSHFFLMIAMALLAGRRLPLLISIPTALVSLYSVSLFVMLLARLYPPSFLRPQLTVTGMSVIPVLTVKFLFILNGLYLAVRSHRDKRMAAFLILLSLGQGADGIFFAFEPLRPLTLLLSMALPYAAFLFVLPGIFKDRKPRKNGTEACRLDSLCRSFGLTGEERDIVAAIAEGKANKEIAFERNTTLSVIKHKIYQLYKKCGINSRWELLALLQ